MKCNDCAGTGRYVSMFKDEPCTACSGKGEIEIQIAPSKKPLSTGQMRDFFELPHVQARSGRKGWLGSEFKREALAMAQPPMRNCWITLTGGDIALDDLFTPNQRRSLDLPMILSFKAGMVSGGNRRFDGNMLAAWDTERVDGLMIHDGDPLVWMPLPQPITIIGGGDVHVEFPHGHIAVL